MASKAKARKTKRPASRAAGRTAGITKQQQKFCEHYALHGNGAEAYGHAYPKSRTNTPKYRTDHAGKLLRKDAIRDAIERLKPEAAEIAEKSFAITAERVLAEMAAIAFANSDDYYRWGTFERPVRKKNKQTGRWETMKDEHGNDITEPVPFAHIKPSDQLTRQQKAAIVGASMTFSKTGDPVVEVKMADKRAALKDLMQHLGLLKTDVSVSGKGGGPVQLVVSSAEANL